MKEDGANDKSSKALLGPICMFDQEEIIERQNAN